jgi:small subunit ribosomal protein S16
MLSIRLQRTGRSGHAQYRIIAQDSRFSPTSGRCVAQLGSYNPHTKAVVLNVELAQKYLNTGAQPSSRMVMILKNAGVKLPSWVTLPEKRTTSIKNTDKLRKNRPVEEVAAPVAEVAVEEAATEALVEAVEPQTEPTPAE